MNKSLSNIDIAFLLSHIPDPRLNKRIAYLKKSGNVSVVCWNRMNSEIWSAKDLDVNKIEIKIKAEYGQPLSRLYQTLKFVIAAKKELKTLKPRILYVCNFDMLILAFLYNLGRNNMTAIFYEVADLNSLIIDKHKGIKRVIQWLVIFLERKICRKIDLLVITSEKFFDVYYKDFIEKSRVMFFPNMPELKPFACYKRKKEGVFTVGFIGFIRYKNQLKMLVDAAQNCNVKVFFAGTGLTSEIEDYCSGKKDVNYYGQYNYDNEIANLYGLVDCVYSVYDADLGNVKVALPNKLYEAIYCGLPIIVAKGTYLAELVENMGVGVAVSHKDQKELISALNKLSNDKDYYQTIVKNCEVQKNKINADYYREELLRIIMSLN